MHNPKLLTAALFCRWQCHLFFDFSGLPTEEEVTYPLFKIRSASHEVCTPLSAAYVLSLVCRGAVSINGSNLDRTFRVVNRVPISSRLPITVEVLYCWTNYDRKFQLGFWVGVF